MAYILVVEDDTLIREIIESIVKGAGHSVHAVGTGLNALMSARQRAPDLILLDMSLPEMNGYLVARELRTHGSVKDIPILAVTAHDSAEDYDAAYQAGCTGFLAKPIDDGRLLKAIDEQLKGAKVKGKK